MDIDILSGGNLMYYYKKTDENGTILYMDSRNIPIIDLPDNMQEVTHDEYMALTRAIVEEKYRSQMGNEQ